MTLLPISPSLPSLIHHLPYDEATLIEQFRDGEEQAFAQVYERFNQRVYFFVRGFLSSTDEAEDVTSEVFIKLWKRRAELPSLDAIGAFLHVAARNQCYDLLRQHQRQADRRPELLAMLDSSAEDHSFDLEDLQMRMLDLISAEIDKLPVKMREIFLLSYQEGLKPSEIAVRLGVHVKTVKNQRLNAVNLLKAALAGHPLLFALLILLEGERKGLIVIIIFQTITGSLQRRLTEC